MICGSCMQDNSWVRALRKAGADATLIPTYTPVRVDDDSLSTPRVFLGGINLFLEHQSAIWRAIPRGLKSWLDHPRIIQWATRFGVSNDATKLGELTLAMLAGENGPQRQQIEELADYLATELQPDVVCFSNALLSGALRTIKQRFRGPVFCTLQGDDIFLDGLPSAIRSKVIACIADRASQFDGFCVHSDYYRDAMSELLHLPVSRFHKIPLGIDLNGHDGVAEKSEPDVLRIGYFARVCPEKGLHLLVEAFRQLHARQPRTRLVVGGYLGPRDADYFKGILKDAATLGDAFEYVGSPDSRADKIKLLKSFDVMSVPTLYREPKGLSILEALANGVPVVQPAHGAFVEMLQATSGGKLFTPGNASELARCLEEFVLDREARINCGRRGQKAVQTQFSSEVMAAATIELFGSERRKSMTETGMTER